MVLLRVVPLLTPEEETYLFWKMNYLKFRTHRLRGRLNPHTATGSQSDKIERLLTEAQTVRNQIIEARFGFNRNPSPTLKELGQGLGISKQRVRQLQQRALDKLRALAERHHVELPGN